MLVTNQWLASYFLSNCICSFTQCCPALPTLYFVTHFVTLCFTLWYLMLLCVADTPAWENLPFFQPAPRIIGGCCFHTNLDPQICSTPLVKKGRLSLSTILETFQQQLEPRDGQHWVPVLQIHKSPCMWDHHQSLSQLHRPDKDGDAGDADDADDKQPTRL